MSWAAAPCLVDVRCDEHWEPRWRGLRCDGGGKACAWRFSGGRPESLRRHRVGSRCEAQLAALELTS